jgi:hypothetical protein
MWWGEFVRIPQASTEVVVVAVVVVVVEHGGWAGVD